MAWRRNLQVSSVGTSAERLGVGADHDGGRAAGAKGAATEETRKGLRLRILPGTGCHRAGPPSKSGARAGGGRSDDFTQSNCGGTEAELATSATTCLHPQPPSRAYICVRNHINYCGLRDSSTEHIVPRWIRTLPAPECLNQACKNHDESYTDTCTPSACIWGNQTRDLDEEILAICRGGGDGRCSQPDRRDPFAIAICAFAFGFRSIQSAIQSATRTCLERSPCPLEAPRVIEPDQYMSHPKFQFSSEACPGGLCRLTTLRFQWERVPGFGF